jgi:hypothetical protein
MQRTLRFLIVSLWIGSLGCLPQQPPRKRTIEALTMSCEEANRLAYQAVNVLGFSVTSMQVATPGQPGHIYATKEGAKDGQVTITCTGSGAIVEPEKTGAPIPSLTGGDRPHEFPGRFMQTFNTLRSTQDIVAKQGPEKGLKMTMTRLNSYESKIELGADLPAGGVLPIKVLISNNTPRPYGFDAGQVVLMATGGGRVSPMAPPASGQGKALQGEMTLAPGQTVSGYLFYPAGSYSSARTTFVDKENEEDEAEGFEVQF